MIGELDNPSKYISGNYEVYVMGADMLIDSAQWLVNVTAIDINGNYSVQSIRYKHLHEANGGAAFYPVGTPPTSSEGQQIVCAYSQHRLRDFQ